jgi:MraZ protein
VPFGAYPYRIDKTGDVGLPPTPRDCVEGGMILTRGIKGCLSIFPQASWRWEDEQVERLSSQRR